MPEEKDYDLTRIKAENLIYLAFLANTSRKISTYEKQFLKRSTMDVLLSTSPSIPDSIKTKLDELYEWAANQGFIEDRFGGHVEGHKTLQLLLTPAAFEHLNRYAYPSEQAKEPEPQQNPIRPIQRQKQKSLQEQARTALASSSLSHKSDRIELIRRKIE